MKTIAEQTAREWFQDLLSLEPSYTGPRAYIHPAILKKVATKVARRLNANGYKHTTSEYFTSQHILCNRY